MKTPQTSFRLTVILLSGLALSGCQSYGCYPGFSTPADAARDLAAFNDVLRSNSDFKGITATAVRGHAVYVTVKPIGRLDAQARNSNISHKLYDAWSTTFAKLHPHAFNRDIVNIQPKDPRGRSLVPMSSLACEMP
jgi:hypothetical protein